MICNTIGLTTDSFETLYVHGGAEVPEVYGSINYAQPIFYSLKTLAGATSYSFMGYPELLKSYEISGNMAQNGTPAPTSPIYPQECGDRTANLLYNVNIVSGGWSAAAGTVPTPVDNPKRCRYNYFFPVASKTVLYDFKDLNVNIVMMDGDGLSLGGSGFMTGTGSFTLLSNTEKISLIIANSDNTEDITESYARSKNISLDYGYKIPINLNGTTQNVYLDEPLRKIGDYADSISSDGTVTRRIKKLVFDGTENWQQAYNAPYMFFYVGISNCGTGAPIMSHFTLGNIGSTTTEIGFAIISRNSLRIRPDLTTIYSVALFKQWLSSQYAAGTPVTLWHVLGTETTEQATAPTITPATGNNTFTIGTTLQPSSLSITGHVKPSS